MTGAGTVPAPLGDPTPGARSSGARSSGGPSSGGPRRDGNVPSGTGGHSTAWSWRTPGGVALALVLIAVVVGGFLLRLWLLGNAPLNSDEATSGLIAHQVLHGHTYAFVWGSLGGVEPYVLAVTFALFGQSPFVLNATPAAIALVGSVLVWRIGLRAIAPPAAVVAAALSWIWAESALWDSVRETGYHQVCVALGLLVLLQALRITQGPVGPGVGRIADWVVLGAAAGLGFWASPEIAYFAVPSAVVVVIALWGRPVGPTVVRIAAAGAAAVVGALPWIWASLGSNRPGIPPSPVSYASRFATFFSHVLPLLLGLRVEGAGVWEGGSTFGPIAYGLLLAFVAVGAVLLVVTRPGSRVLVLTLALYPFLYAAFPTAWFWNDGRYALALSPVLSLVVAGGLWQLVRPPVAAWAGCLLLAAAMTSTLVALNDGYGMLGSTGELTTFAANPNPAITSLAGRLSRLGVTHAYAGYWVANSLTFIAGDRVTALAVGVNHNPPDATDAGTTPAAWVFVPTASLPDLLSQLGSATDVEPGSVDEASFRAWLTAHGIRYRLVESSGFDIVLPSRNVSPAEVGA